MPENGTTWVIDTCVLHLASDFNDERCLAASGFLLNVRLRHSIALDVEGNIEREYRGCFAVRANEFQRKWWRHMTKQAGKAQYFNGTVPGVARAHLLGTLRFDSTDLPFIGVAHRTPDKLLVSEDSDYTQKVKKYLHGKLGVRTIGVEDAELRPA